MAAVTRRILGIDPGSHHLGVGCVEKCGNRLRLIFSDTVHANKKDGLYDRLATISLRFHEILDQLQPHEIAVEDIFFAKNVRSAIFLGTARGMAIGACLKRGLKIHEYAPTQVKSVVTGCGRADKTQVSKMVQIILGIKADMDLGFDTTDALAVALCHANHLDRRTLN